MAINELIARGIGPTYSQGEAESRKMQNMLAAFRMGQGMLQNEQNAQRLQMDREKMAMEKDQAAREQEKWEMVKRNEPMQRHLSALNMLYESAGQINYGNYDTWRQRAIDSGLYPDALPERSVFDTEGINTATPPDQIFERKKKDFMTSSSKFLEQAKAAGALNKVVPSGGTLVGGAGEIKFYNAPKGKEYEPQKFVKDGKVFWLKPGDPIPEGAAPWEKASKEAQPEIVKLIDALNATDDEETKKILSARINKLTETTGLSVRMNKDGEFELVQGPGVKPGATGFGKTAKNKAEEKLFDTTESLSRLTAIEGLAKPEFQEMGTKWGMWSKALKEKAGYKLNENEKKSLEDFSKYRRRAYEHLNKYLNEISGAAITEQEARRLLKTLPDPGENIWDGDSPTEFKAKLEDAMQSARWAIARYNYAMKNGLNWKTISLENMPEIVNERASQIEAEVKRPGMDAGTVRQEVKKRLAAEFGVMGK